MPLRADQRPAVDAARATCEKMRNGLPVYDITPDLYLYAALHEYLLYGEMNVLVDDMLRKQPDSEQVKALASWVRSRTAR